MTDNTAEKIYDLAVVGAGPAGLAAAIEAAHHGWQVIVFEQQAETGGKAVEYTCKADTQCRICGVCQVCKASNVAAFPENLEVRTLSTVKNATSMGDHTLLEIIHSDDPDQRYILQTTRLILATGFEPFDLTEKPALGYGRFRNVISLEILEKHLGRNRPIKALPIPDSGNVTSISMAFVQCVGSRDVSLNTPYCSQVCCQVALRLANRIKHLNPETNCDMFYMDLQIHNACDFQLIQKSAAVNLIRAKPSELTRDPDGQLRIRYEKSETQEIIESTYDLVVLAGAMRPVLPMVDLTGLPDLVQNNIGFWEINAVADSNSHLAVAGAASGPMDILSAMAHGRHITRNLIQAATETHS